MSDKSRPEPADHDDTQPDDNVDQAADEAGRQRNVYADFRYAQNVQIGNSNVQINTFD